MKKIYRPLTLEQRNRGVIFSSTLSSKKLEQSGDTIHEVYKDDAYKETEIENLKNDRFFDDNPCGWRYNIIRS
jgi:hypothetical protein